MRVLRGARRRLRIIVPRKTGASEQGVDSVGADRWGSMPNGALCEPWPGSVSSELAADAGAVTIRVSGEGGVGTWRPPHIPPTMNATNRVAMNSSAGVPPIL